MPETWIGGFTDIGDDVGNNASGVVNENFPIVCRKFPTNGKNKKKK